MLVNEFYSGILIHANESKNLVRFCYDTLYTFFDDQECKISESILGKLIGCHKYNGPYEAPNHYPFNNVWDTLAVCLGCQKVASNLKFLPLTFLHHFIALTMQCSTGSFTKVTIDDIWLLEMASSSTKINLARFIINKMIKVIKNKENEAKSKKTTEQSQVSIPYVTLITQYAKSSGDLNPKYVLVKIVVKYNLASIAKMGYKDHNKMAFL